MTKPGNEAIACEFSQIWHFVNDVGLASLVLYGPQYSSEHHVTVCYNIVGVFSATQDVFMK